MNISFQLALSSFFESDQDPYVQDDEDNNDVESSSSQPPQVPTSLFGSSSDKNKNDVKNKGKHSSAGARIMTLNNMASDDEDDDASGQVSTRNALEYKSVNNHFAWTQAFYAGGSDSSGQQVLGPPRKNKDFVSNIFKSAKESGAEVVENQPSSRPSGSRG